MTISWKKWVKRLFVFLHSTLLGMILVASSALYIAFRPDGLELIDTYLFEPLGIDYTHAEGTLLEGFTLHNLKHEETYIKALSLDYNLTRILKGEHVVESITIDGLRIHLDDFTDNGNGVWPFPTFQLKSLKITNLQLISSYPIELDITGENGSYDGDELNFNTINASVKTQYCSGSIHGILQHNSITGTALLYPNAAELAPYSGKFTDLPRVVQVQIQELSDSRAHLRGKIDSLILKQDSALHAEEFAFDFATLYENDFLDVNATYLLRRGEDSMQTSHSLRYAYDGKTTTRFNGSITTQHPLPSNTLIGEFTDDSDGIRGKLTLGMSVVTLASSDYDRFGWKFDTLHNDLAFLPMLPEFLRTSPLNARGEGIYTLNSNIVEGSAEIIQNNGRFKGGFIAKEGNYRLNGMLTLPHDAPLWKESGYTPPENIALTLTHEANTTQIQLDNHTLALFATLQGNSIKGSGNYIGAYFDISGSHEANQTTIDVDTIIPSLRTTVSHLRPILLHNGEYYDAEIRSKTHLNITDTLHIQSDIKIPWYAAVPDSQRSFGGTDGSASLTYEEGNITLKRYRFEVADHIVSSNKPSHLSLLPDGELTIHEFWVYDSLLLTGSVQPDMSASLHLGSEEFHYQGPEGEARAKIDIAFTRDREAYQSLTGNVVILDALISNLPFKQFKVMDDDIIIVQDIRPPSETKLSTNLHITAEKPIRYKTKELSLNIDPDITLWKEPTHPMQILGMITLPSGIATTAGKEFDIKHSEIYFGGDLPLNPYLSLTIGHEVDYKKILIYVTHTLDSPIFLFASDPVMSQNDIMSYILFGTPANTSQGGDNSTSGVRADATNFMIGAGLKGLINGVTKIQIDTMNILTTAEGGMGFEVGARLNKDLRLLYKNDTVSSVLIQYTLNRWLRLDVDIHELGQGINAVYVKDFRDFLPHNKKPTR